MSAKSSYKYIILAVILGEIALILLTTIAQEVLYDGISFATSSNIDMIFGGLATFVAAVIAGIIAVAITRGSTRIPPTIISILIFAEMTYLMLSGKLNNPIWFDILSGLSLILGIWLGYYIVKKFLKSSAI